MAKDALAAHSRDELGILAATTARPVQAALTSALTFTAGRRSRRAGLESRRAGDLLGRHRNGHHRRDRRSVRGRRLSSSRSARLGQAVTPLALPIGATPVRLS